RVGRALLSAISIICATAVSAMSFRRSEGIMALTRDQICHLTSRKLAEKAHSLKSVKATVGLDGFVDEIIAVVDKRHDGGKFDPVKTIGHLGAKITAAAGESSNYELVVKQRKLGGNGPIMANA